MQSPMKWVCIGEDEQRSKADVRRQADGVEFARTKRNIVCEDDMIEIKKKSVIPVYSAGAAWVLYCLIFPLYKTYHFIILVGLAALAYVVLSAIFPGKTEQIEVPEEPVRTGNDEIDALLAEGEKAVGEMRRLRGSIPGEPVRKQIDEIITVTGEIFNKLRGDPGDYKQVKRFADYYLPTTIKLLHTYDRFSQSSATGENITGTMERIETALDTILESYKKLFDSLFMHQAIDIETDIRVLESMLRNDF